MGPHHSISGTSVFHDSRGGITITRPNRLHEDRERHLMVGDGLPLELVFIPGGTFLMGSPADEPGRSDSEGPQHAVTVPSFLMGRYPVTQAQWRAVAALPKVRRSLDPDPSEFKGDNRPVEYVSWAEAVEFCDRIAQQTKRPYRLPTEAEWEYACRAETTTPFHFGETLTTEVCNCDGRYTYGGEPRGIFRETTTPVGYFEVTNAFGLSDMHGNVREWCQDHWHWNYTGAPVNGRAWLFPVWRIFGRRDQRVLRGGTWRSFPEDCRSASRDYGPQDFSDDDTSFRLVLSGCCCSSGRVSGTTRS